MNKQPVWIKSGKPFEVSFPDSTSGGKYFTQKKPEEKFYKIKLPTLHNVMITGDGPFLFVKATEDPNGEIKKEFQSLWDSYPKKRGSKKTAEKSYINWRLKYSREDFEKALANYKIEIKLLNREFRHILNGQTFFGPGGYFENYLPDNFCEDDVRVGKEARDLYEQAGYNQTVPDWAEGEI